MVDPMAADPGPDPGVVPGTAPCVYRGPGATLGPTPAARELYNRVATTAAAAVVLRRGSRQGFRRRRVFGRADIGKGLIWRSTEHAQAAPAAVKGAPTRVLIRAR
ncbi:hypothetical protein MRX96_050030 [Rhipicephalus microplus]